MMFKCYVTIFLLLASCELATATAVYDGVNHYIYTQDSRTTLSAIESQINNPSIITHSGSTYYLNTSIVLRNGGSLIINNSECSLLLMSNQINGVRLGNGGIEGPATLNNLTIESWNYTAKRKTGYPIDPESDLFSVTIPSSTINNCKFDGVKSLLITNLYNANLNNITLINSTGPFSISTFGNISVSNLSVINISNSGFYTNFGNGIRVKNFYANVVGGDAIELRGNDSYLENAYIVTAGHNGVNYDISDKVTIKNCTVLHNGHVGIDFHMVTNGLIDGATLKNSDASSNILLSDGNGAGQVYNITINNLTTVRDDVGAYYDGISMASSDGYPLISNVTITNWTSIGEETGLAASGIKDVTITNFTTINDDWGIYYRGTGSRIASNVKLIDSNITYCRGASVIYFENNNNMAIINSKYGYHNFYQGANRNNSYTTYYYPNIRTLGNASNPISNVKITANTTTLNGKGKIQSSFLTDSSGKLFDSGNRSNWMAIPEKTVRDNGTKYYISLITASKSDQNNSTVIFPSGDWYSPNPASLQGSQIVLTINSRPNDNNYYTNGDTNNHGIVNTSYITLIYQHYGEIYSNKPYPYWDVNQDGVINLQDLILVESNLYKQ